MPENRIVTARFQRRLAEELNIDAPAPVPVLAPEIVPVMVVENERRELQHLMQEHRFGCTLTIANVAAEYVYFFLQNPADSGSLVIVESFGIGCAANQTFDFGEGNSTFVASLSGRNADCLDQRIAQNALGRPCVANPLVGTDPNTGGVVNLIGRGRAAANAATSRFCDLDYILAPGNIFGIFITTVNVGIDGYCWWRERVATNGELV